jgi:putative ABC transport system ATP-binding protein
MSVLLTFNRVSKRYHSGASGAVAPLDDVDLGIDEGERVILLGKSGSGKTTLLNLAGGVDQPTSGSILFRNRDIASMSPTELAWYRRKEVGFIFQSFNLFPTLTVGENLMLPLELLGNSDESKAKSLLASVGLEGQWEKFPEQLSGGEQQRVAIVRALVKDPSFILADEPKGNLDQETGSDILELIYASCTERNATLIVATHSPDALWLAHRRFNLRSGKLEELPEETGGELGSHADH